MSVRVQTFVWELPLTPSQKLVAIALADHCHDDGSEARPSRALLARKTGLSEATLKRVCKELLELGVIVLQRPANQHYANVYQFVLPEGFARLSGGSSRAVWKNSGGSFKSQRGHGEPPQGGHGEPLNIIKPSIETSPLEECDLEAVKARNRQIFSQLSRRDRAQ